MPKLVELIFGPGSTRQAEKLVFFKSGALPCDDLSTSFLRGGIHSTHEHLPFRSINFRLSMYPTRYSDPPPS